MTAVKNTDYSHLTDDVKTAQEYLQAAKAADTNELRSEMLFRAGVRLLRAESGLAALNNAIELVDDVKEPADA